MWAGITGYFIGLAITGPYRKYSIGLVGIGIAAILHGLNDWSPINSHLAWVLVTLISVLLFLGYARAGAWLPQQALASRPPLARSRPAPSRPAPPASPGPPSGPWAASPPAHTPPPLRPRPAGYGAPTGRGSPAGPGVPAPSAGPPRPGEAWWQRAPAAGAGPVPAPPPAHGSPAPPATVQRKPAPKPWWEQ